MVFNWDEEKNKQLKIQRKISFERIIIAIESGDILDILEHPNKDKYPDQYLIIVKIDNYAYVVPSIKKKQYWFLKNIFPSRKYTNEYLLKEGG